MDAYVKHYIAGVVPIEAPTSPGTYLTYQFTKAQIATRKTNESLEMTLRHATSYY